MAGPEANVSMGSGGDNVQEGDDNNPQPPTGPDSEVRNFSRTFVHYISLGVDGDGEDTWFWDGHDPATENTGDLDFIWSWRNIPYWSMGASMTAQDFQTSFLGCKRFRVHNMGFKMSNIIPTTEELGTVGGTVTETLTFNQRPYMYTYVDEKHAVFQCNQKIFESDDMPNDNFSVNLPNTRAQGELATIQDRRKVPIDWYTRNVAPDEDPIDPNAGPLEKIISPFNTDGWKTFHTGESWEYTWGNPSKLWYPTMDFSYMGDRGHRLPTGEDAWDYRNMMAEVGPWDQGQVSNSWAPRANSTDWPFTVTGEQDLVNLSSNRGKMLTTMLPFLNNSPPPIACIRSPKLLKGNNEPMKLTFQVTCTYHSTIEFERMNTGGAQNAGWMPAVSFLSTAAKDPTGLNTYQFLPHQVNLCQWPFNQRVYGAGANNAQNSQPVSLTR